MIRTSKEIYKDYSRFYDDYTDDVIDDLVVYNKFITPNDTILEIGCGTGRVTLSLLSKNPKKIIGVDTSKEMLDIARKKLKTYILLKKLSLIEHDFSYNNLIETYNIAFITYYTINYILTDIENFIANIATSLSSNGLLVIDCFISDIINNPELNNMKRVFEPFKSNNHLYFVTDKRILRDDIETRTVIFDDKKGDKVEMETTRRFYSPNEIERILTNLGFIDIKYSYGYPYSKKLTKGNFIIEARKR